VTPVLTFFEKPRTYSVVLCLAACLYFYLFVTLLFASPGFLASIGVPGNESAYFLARRASALMLGFAVLAFLARNLRSAVARRAVAFSIAVNMAGFAVLSIAEFRRGFANSGILTPAVVESLLAAVCFLLWLAARQAARREETHSSPTPRGRLA
jgi:hypothetical protein